MSSYPVMDFPKKEWQNIAKNLAKEGSCSTIRSCQQIGKYKVGDFYKTPWGDIVKIIKVVRYKKAEDIPSWNILDRGMKVSVRKAEKYGDNQWDYVIFEKILIYL